jgi:hypothetical protein
MIKRKQKSNTICDGKLNEQPQRAIEIIKAIHRTNNFKENYEIVDVINNPISETNFLAKIRKENGEEFITGGILCEINPITISILNKLNNEEQWNWLCSIRKEMINNYV